MQRKDITYLQVKSTADRILAGGESPNTTQMYDLLGYIGTKKQISEYMKRWRSENIKALRELKKSKQLSPTPSNSISDKVKQAKELQESLSLVRATLEATADGILMINNEGKFVDWNQRFIEIAQLPKEVLEKGKEDEALKYIINSMEDPQELMGLMLHLQQHPDEEGIVGEVKMKNGRIFERYCQPHRVGDRVVGRVWSFRDVTARRIAEEELQLRKRAIESSTSGVLIAKNSPDLEIQYVNPAFEDITGYRFNDIKGSSIDFIYASDRQQGEVNSIKLAIKEERDEQVVLRCYKKDGSFFWNEMHISPVMHSKIPDQVTHYVAIINDITERKAMEEQLIHQATHDSLTDLPNRVLLHDRISQAIQYAIRDNSMASILFLDLDRFKNVNDGLGHKMGDSLLCAVSKRLQNNLRSTDTVARLGGDEFIVILSPIEKPEDTIRIGHHLMAEIRKPFRIQERELNITTSMGIANYPKDGKDSDTLVRHADTAMYHAKDYGRDNFQFFTEDMNRVVSARLVLENCLRTAIKNNEFSINYQPVLNLKSNKVVGLEALVRWDNPELGRVSPVEFIPMAEEMGLIIPLGEWVFQKACEQAVIWHQAGIHDLQMAINVSGRQLQDPGFLDIVSSIVKNTGVDPKSLILELTESMLMRCSDDFMKTLYALRNMGIRLAIDDFGTGYSSLGYLKNLPVDKLKIDQTFVSDIGSDENDEAIILAIIAVAKSLNLKVLAEGAQTKHHMDFLREHLCDEVQGFYFSKPLESDRCTTLLRENRGLL